MNELITNLIADCVSLIDVLLIPIIYFKSSVQSPLPGCRWTWDLYQAWCASNKTGSNRKIDFMSVCSRQVFVTIQKWHWTTKIQILCVEVTTAHMWTEFRCIYIFSPNGRCLIRLYFRYEMELLEQEELCEPLFLRSEKTRRLMSSCCPTLSCPPVWTFRSSTSDIYGTVNVFQV